MAKKTDEEKLVDLLEQVTNNYWFNPVVAAHLIANLSLYNQDKIVDLIAEVVKAQAIRFQNEIEHDRTTAGLMLAAHLAEVVEMHEPIE
mgnify:FL=1